MEGRRVGADRGEGRGEREGGREERGEREGGREERGEREGERGEGERSDNTLSLQWTGKLQHIKYKYIFIYNMNAINNPGIMIFGLQCIAIHTIIYGALLRQYTELEVKLHQS